jgi:hypothetical protein
MAKKQSNSLSNLKLTEPTARQEQLVAKKRDSRFHLRQLEAELFSHLENLGDRIAEDNHYDDLDGIEAVQYFLMEKHHWTPAQVKSMSWDDLRFAMSQEPAPKKKRV